MFQKLKNLLPGDKLTGGKLETREASLANPDDWFRELFGATTTAAGVSVNAKTAMRCTPVRCAVESIAETVSTLPLHTFQRNVDGSKERDRSHAVAKVLSKSVNPWTPSQTAIEQILRDALCYGNGYFAVTRINGDVAELNRLDPNSVKVETSNSEPVYSVKLEHGSQQYHYNDIIHLKAPSTDGVTGESPIDQCKEAIATCLVLERHANGLFGNSARPGGVIQVPGPLGDAGLKNMRKAWRSAHEGASNAGKTAVLWDGATFNPLTMNSTDAQFIEARRFAIDEIARAFRVPPHLLFEMGRATWGNASEMSATFLRFGLMRWIVALQAEFNLKLFSESEQDTHFCQFIPDAFLQSDLTARATAYSTMIAARVLSPNEARALENRAPYKGGDTFENPNTSTTKKEPVQ